MKLIILDASTIITLTMNGLEYILEELKTSFEGKFIITQQVKKEIIDRPLTIRSFKLGALRSKRLLDSGVLELPEAIGISNSDLNKKAQEILNQVNKAYMADNEPIKLIHDGEASCLALSLLASAEKIENIIAVDERTTRMLVEKPENLRKLMKRKLHKSVHFRKNLPNLNKIRIIRSSELVYIAYKLGLTNLKDGPGILDAMLYATKFKGAAISDEEIEQIKKLN